MTVDITTVGTRLILGELDEKGLENAWTIFPLQDHKVSKRIRGDLTRPECACSAVSML